MVVRRIREHAAGHNWFAVLIDLAIVIIGVFIGLQVSNWNAVRIERAEVREYRAQIVENLKANEREIAAGIRYYQQVRDHSLAALEAWEGIAPPDEAFLIHSYQASQFWPVRMERSAYDEMIASGMAKSFGDPAIRRQLSAYHAAMRQFESTAVTNTAYRERVRRALMFRVQQRLRERCNEVLRPSPEGSHHPTLPDKCALQISPELISLAGARLRATSELDQDLTRHLGDLDVKLALFKRWLRRTGDMRHYLERMEG
jgi:hypothetical protein